MNDLPVIFYIEATAPSASLRDIKFEAEYAGKKDNISATAVWVDFEQYWSNRSATPVPGTSELPNVGGIITKAINVFNIAKDSTRYGHGDCTTSPAPYDGSSNDKYFGGRILMEWKVKPEDAGSLVSFDVTRQRKTKTWYAGYGGGEPFTLSNESKDFPFEEGKNIEEPNDDGADGVEDRIPINNTLYSWDRPSVAKKHPAQDSRAFHVSKNWFKEFVRVRVKSSPFSIQDNTLQGSCSSDKFDWHCVYYARRDEGYEIGVDNLNASHCHLKSTQIDVNDYFGVAASANNVDFEYGVFLMIYEVNNAEKEIRIRREIGIPNPPISQTFKIPVSQTVWNINFEGVELNLEELAPIPNLTFINFNTFKTNATSKENIIKNGIYENFTR